MTGNLYVAKIRYDADFDLLSIRRPAFKTTYNVTIGDINLEFFHDQVIGINVADALDFLKKSFSGYKISKEQLLKIDKAKIGFITSGTSLVVIFLFVLPNKEVLEARYMLPVVSREVLAITA